MRSRRYEKFYFTEEAKYNNHISIYILGDSLVGLPSNYCNFPNKIENRVRKYFNYANISIDYFGPG